MTDETRARLIAMGKAKQVETYDKVLARYEELNRPKVPFKVRLFDLCIDSGILLSVSCILIGFVFDLGEASIFGVLNIVFLLALDARFSKTPAGSDTGTK